MDGKSERVPNPATHQPTKAEMEEVIEIDGTPEEIAASALRGGALRKEVRKPDE